MFCFQNLSSILKRPCLSMAKCITQYAVVPELSNTFPKSLINVSYSWGASVEFGNELTPRRTRTEPTLSWNANPSHFYTLIMIDPDVPCRHNPMYADWNHWLIVNIPGCDVDKGEVLSEYIGPLPLSGSGYHRYMFLVFKQLNKMTFNEPLLVSSSTEGRANFSAEKFSVKYFLGCPIAGNYFKARFDEYVSKAIRELGKPY